MQKTFFMSFQEHIEELESHKAAMEVDLESKQGTVQRLVAVSQNLQHRNDKLKEQDSRLSKELESNSSALDSQIAATVAADERRKTAQQELDCSLNETHALVGGLVAA